MTESLTPERIENGWRVRTRCSQCGIEMVLDSEEEPNEMALQIARFAMACDECIAHAETAGERRRLDIDHRSRIDTSGLPRDLRALQWDEMDRSSGRRQAVVAAHAWSEHGRGVFLYGPLGTGKTRLAATAAWEMLYRRRLTWMSVPLLFVHAFGNKNSPENRRAIEVMGGREALVLDDLGKEKPGDWARQVLFGAIDSRIQAGSPLLITSNFKPSELANRLGDAFGSRIAGYCEQYELVGSDRRLEQRSQVLGV